MILNRRHANLNHPAANAVRLSDEMGTPRAEVLECPNCESSFYTHTTGKIHPYDLEYGACFAIEFWCELCPHLFGLYIEQYKGHTALSTRVLGPTLESAIHGCPYFPPA